MPPSDTMLILASKSPSRRQLLTNAGLIFKVQPAQIDERALETALQGSDPATIARELAQKKAIEVSLRNTDAVVIGADQMLDFKGQTLHKPKDRQEAKQQLLAFRRNTHTLHAAFALARNGEILSHGIEQAHMTMRDFSEPECNHILDLMDESYLYCVGAYSLEGAAVQLFDRIDGDYFTILGLPMLPLLAALRKTGIM